MYNMPLICITCHSSSFSIFTGPSFPCVGCDCTSFDHSGDHFHENFELALPKNQQKYIWGQPSFCHWFGHLWKVTLDVYDAALAVLKPTPTKSHYVFSTCDVRRVVQGTMLARLKQLPDGACVGVVGCWVVVLGGVGCCW